MIDRIFQKSKMNKWLVKLVKKYDKQRIKPNQLTTFALILGISSSIFVGLSGYVLEVYFIILAALSLLISLILDIFDGILARLRGPTLFGGIFDLFSDRIVEISAIIGIVLTDPTKLSLAGLVTVSSIVLCITIFLLLGNINPNSIPEQKKVIFYARGMMERTETGIFFLVLICIPITIIRLIVFYSFSGLVLITTIQRFIIAYRVLRATENNSSNNP